MTAPSGDDIRRAREARHWSQATLAKAAGVNPSTIWRIETGKYNDPRKLGPIVAALGLDGSTEPRLSQATGGQLAAELLTRLNELDELQREVASLRAQVATSDHFEGDEDLPPEELAKLRGQPPTANGVTFSS